MHGYAASASIRLVVQSPARVRRITRPLPPSLHHAAFFRHCVHAQGSITLSQLLPTQFPPVPSPCILRSTVTKSVQVWPTSSSHCCSKLPHGLPQDVTARVLHHALPHRTRFTQLDFSSLNPVPSPPGGPLSIGLAMPLPVPSSPCRPSRRPRFMVTIATLHYSFVKRPTP